MGNVTFLHNILNLKDNHNNQNKAENNSINKWRMSNISVLYLTRMNSICGHSFSLHHASELLGEVDVGQLAATVGEEGEQVVVEILEVELLVFVAGAGQVDHSAR